MKPYKEMVPGAGTEERPQQIGGGGAREEAGPVT